MADNLTLIIILIAVAANIVTFVLVGLDKNKSIAGRDRLPEVYFFLWSILLSSLGVLAGMMVFRHKIRKWYFPFGIGLLLFQQVLLIYLLLQ